MPTKYTPAQLQHLRLLARDEGGDAAYARRLLIADGNGDYNARIRKENARINSARSNNEDINAARFPTLFAAPKTKTTINRTKSAAAIKAIARNRKTSGR